MRVVGYGLLLAAGLFALGVGMFFAQLLILPVVGG